MKTVSEPTWGDAINDGIGWWAIMVAATAIFTIVSNPPAVMAHADLVLAQTKPESGGGMKTWGAQEWGMFFAALGVLLTVAGTAIGAMIAKIIAAWGEVKKSLQKNTEASQTNAKALVTLMDANQADPSTPDIDPSVENAVRCTATGTGDGGKPVEKK